GLMSRWRSRNQMPEMICAESSRLEPILDNAAAILCAWAGATSEIFRGRAGINVRQVKTGRELWVPILEPLRRAMETWERRPGPFCLDIWGQPWTRKRLTEAWSYERKTNPALRALLDADLVLHGLRGHACVRLYRAGCATRDVASWWECRNRWW